MKPTTIEEAQQAQTIADIEPAIAYERDNGAYPFPAFSANEVGKLLKAAMAAANPNSPAYSWAIECEWLAKADELENLK